LAPAAQTEDDPIEHLSRIGALATSGFSWVFLHDDRLDTFPKLVRYLPNGFQGLFVAHTALLMFSEEPYELYLEVINHFEGL